MKIRHIKRKKFKVLRFIYDDIDSHQVKVCNQCKYRAAGKYQIKTLIIED